MASTNTCISIAHKPKEMICGRVSDTWLAWMQNCLRVIPKNHRVPTAASGIWHQMIYEDLFRYCEPRLSEDLLIETMRSYKIFLVNWNSFVDEEDPEILRRSTRGITIRTKGLSKIKVCLRIIIFSLLLDGNSHPVACAWLSTLTSNQGKKAIEKINSRIGYIIVCIVSEYGVQATGPYGFIIPTVDQVLQIQEMPSKKHIKDIEAE